VPRDPDPLLQLKTKTRLSKKPPGRIVIRGMLMRQTLH
jgi:hypothetical protein